MTEKPAGTVVALLALSLFAGCSRPAPPNIVLISIDTLRADHLGCYGYGPATSPVLDGLAQRSTLFTEALAPTPWTLPSHAAMLTGVHPFKLGILSRDGMLPKATPTLAELVAGAGYATAAFVDSEHDGFIGSDRGFARGFASFATAPFPTAEDYRYDMRASVTAFKRWLKKRERSRPFFVFLHTYSVHATPEEKFTNPLPYHKPQRYLERFVAGGKTRYPWRTGKQVAVGFLRDLNRRIADGEVKGPALSDDERRELIALYDAGIYFVDEQIGVLLAALKREGLGRDTVVIVTADHGEAFLEHRFVLHRELYEPLLHVPLIVFDPRAPAAARVPGPVLLEDVAATVLALAGARAPATLDGASLLRGAPPPPRPRYSFYRFGPHAPEAYALRDGRYKLIAQRLASDKPQPFENELFDLEADPAERHPLAEDSEAALRLVKELASWRSREPAPSTTLAPSKQSLEELRALGYVQ